MRPWLPAILFLAQSLPAQLTTGIIEGILRDARHHAVGGMAIVVEGGAGFVTTIHTDQQGHFTVTLPYGQYRFSSAAVTVAPLQATRIELTVGSAGIASAEALPGFWLDTTRAQT